MAIPRVKVVNLNEGWLGTECCMDGKKIPNVRSVDFHVALDEVPQFTFETVQQAAAVLKHEFETNEKSRFALYDSIRSVLDESDIECPSINMLAVKIGNRIIGLEDK